LIDGKIAARPVDGLDCGANNFLAFGGGPVIEAPIGTSTSDQFF
jgi:hypothetical protein